MALINPTLKEIADNILNDIESEFGQSVPTLAKSAFRVWAYAQAGIYIILYKYGNENFKQRFVQTANSEYLGILGEQVNIIRANPVKFTGTVNVTLSENNYQIVREGTQLSNNLTNIVYTITETVTLQDNVTPVPIDSVVSSTDADLAIGAKLRFVSPQVGVKQETEVASIKNHAKDLESIEQYRQRVLDRYQKRPQGGSIIDYELWSEETPDVINAYVYAADFPGHIDIFIEVDNQPDGIPSTEQLELVKKYIDFDPTTGRATRRPVTAIPNLKPIVRNEFQVYVFDLSPQFELLKSLIDKAVENYFKAKEPYIMGSSVVKKDKITRAELTIVILEIAQQNKSDISNILIKKAGVFNDIIVLDKGEKAKVQLPLTYINAVT